MGYLNTDSALRIALYHCQKQTDSLSTVSGLYTYSAISHGFEGFCRRSEEPVKHEERELLTSSREKPQLCALQSVLTWHIAGQQETQNIPKGYRRQHTECKMSFLSIDLICQEEIKYYNSSSAKMELPYSSPQCWIIAFCPYLKHRTDIILVIGSVVQYPPSANAVHCLYAA